MTHSDSAPSASVADAYRRLISIPNRPDPIAIETFSGRALELGSAQLHADVFERVVTGEIPYALHDGRVLIPMDLSLAINPFAVAAGGGYSIPRAPRQVPIQALRQPLWRIGPAPLEQHLDVEPLRPLSESGFEYAEYDGDIFVSKTIHDDGRYDDNEIDFGTARYSDLPRSLIVD